jgi:hypothetical protein
MSKQPASLTLETVTQMAHELRVSTGACEQTIIIEGTKGRFVIPLTKFGSSPRQRLADIAKAGFILGIKNQVGELEQVFLMGQAWMSIGVRRLDDGQRSAKKLVRGEVLSVSRISLLENKQGQVVEAISPNLAGKITEVERAALMSNTNPLLTTFVYSFSEGLKQALV